MFVVIVKGTQQSQVILSWVFEGVASLVDVFIAGVVVAGGCVIAIDVYGFHLFNRRIDLLLGVGQTIDFPVVGYELMEGNRVGVVLIYEVKGSIDFVISEVGVEGCKHFLELFQAEVAGLVGIKALKGGQERVVVVVDFLHKFIEEGFDLLFDVARQGRERFVVILVFGKPRNAFAGHAHLDLVLFHDFLDVADGDGIVLVAVGLIKDVVRGLPFHFWVNDAQELVELCFVELALPVPELTQYFLEVNVLSVDLEAQLRHQCFEFVFELHGLLTEIPIENGMQEEFIPGNALLLGDAEALLEKVM